MLNDRQFRILVAAAVVNSHHRPGRWIEPTAVTWLRADLRSVQLWHALARRGFLDRMQQSEHVRGEKRMSWWLFRINDAGTAALAKGGTG